MASNLYPLEARATTRETYRRLAKLGDAIKIAEQGGPVLDEESCQIANALTRTDDASRQTDILYAMSERIKTEHLAKLKPLAAEDFNAFCEYIIPDEPPESKFHIWLTQYLEKIEKDPTHNFHILCVPPGHAKDQELSTPIFTPSGWTTMGEIQIGDELFDETGAVCRVTWKSPVYKDQKVYRVATDCGDEVVCGAGHEWPVMLCRKKFTWRNGIKKPRIPKLSIKTTAELFRIRSKRPMIPRAGVLQTPHRDLLIDPYVLGVWLGDGGTKTGVIAQGEVDMIWMKEEFSRLGYDTSDRADPQVFGVYGLQTKLKKIGVFHQKHIPVDYILASPEQRLSLLQGLIDTDGTVASGKAERKSSDAGQVSFCNTNRDLIEEVQFLVRSLGIKATISESRAMLGGKDYGPVWRVSFYHPEAARMPRKRALCRAATRTTDTYIDVTEAGFADTQCIEVDSPNHLFLCGRSMTPTHNPLDVNTLVTMGDGTSKRLGDVETGDMVLSHLGIPRRVLGVHEQGKLDVVNVKTMMGRQIIAAPDHPFAVVNGERTRWVAAGDLKPGDPLSVVTVPADSENISGHHSDSFELAAYLIARSTCPVVLNKTNLLRNVIMFHAERDVIDAMARCLARLDISHTPKPYRKSSGLWTLSVNGPPSTRLRNLYSGVLKPDRRIPDFIFRGGPDERRVFLSTLFSISAEAPLQNKGSLIQLALPSGAMAQQVQALLAGFGVHAVTYQKNRNNSRHYVTVADKNLVRYFEAGLTYTGPHADTLFQGVKTRYPKDEAVWGVSKAGQAECRCLTVDEDHTFIANGVVVHNSTYASRLFVAWRLGRRPSNKIIGGGHSQAFVENEFSKKIRTIVGGKSFKDIFPEVSIASHTRAADQWATAEHGGQYVASGVGKGVHGFRANFICVDDPYPNLKTAGSPAYRAEAQTWFFKDLQSRRLPDGIVFLVMTRFHPEDLVAEAIKRNPSRREEDRYQVIEIPAICYDPETDVMGRSLGEVLWDFYNLDYFQNQLIDFGLAAFSLLFQQIDALVDPDSIAAKLQTYKRLPHQTDEALKEAEAAGQFTESGFPKVDRSKYFRRFFTSVDCATKNTERADYTVAQVWAETGDRKFYLVDQVRGKWEFDDIVSEIEKISRKWDVSAILVEDKGHGSAYIQNRGQTDQHRRLAPAPIIAIQVPNTESKKFRFDDISPMITAGEVYIPESAPWLDLFLQEISQFPDGAKDDQVDALSQALKWARGKRRRYGTKKITSQG